MKLFKHLIILTWALVAHAQLSAQEVELAERLLQSYLDNQPFPLISLIQPDLSVEQAYSVQRHYVKGRLANEKLVGFKAGLTSEPAQKKFNVSQPVVGVLFANGDLSSRQSSVKLSQFKNLMLETELGFEIGQAITDLVSDKKQIKQYIKSIFPLIELPELSFVSPPTGIDIIAANVGAAAFIKGQPVDNLAHLNLNALGVTLTREGEPVNVGQGRDALGDQWEAVWWLVNTLVKLGWKLEPGQFVITGAMGKMIKAEPGNYQADFGELGNLSFTITP